MAQVDFTNAILELVTDNTQPFAQPYVNLNTAYLRNANNQSIVGNNARATWLTDEQKQLLVSYTGTFTESGTELYIYGVAGSGKWKVSNISFQNGDAYTFEIPVTLTCL